MPRGLHADQRPLGRDAPSGEALEQTLEPLLRVSELERLDGDLPAVAHRGRHVRPLRDVDPDVEHLSPPSSRRDEGFPSESAGATSWEIRRRTPFCLIRVHPRAGGAILSTGAVPQGGARALRPVRALYPIFASTGKEARPLREKWQLQYRRRSTIVTTNVGIGAWAKVFGDPVVASAIADRLCHHCTVLKITGRSYRTKDLAPDRDAGSGA